LAKEEWHDLFKTISPSKILNFGLAIAIEWKHDKV
jgi:hypothetical protein